MGPFAQKCLYSFLATVNCLTTSKYDPQNLVRSYVTKAIPKHLWFRVHRQKNERNNTTRNRYRPIKLRFFLLVFFRSLGRLLHTRTMTVGYITLRCRKLRSSAARGPHSSMRVLVLIRLLSIFSKHER